jgi:hypothetical protein
MVSGLVVAVKIAPRRRALAVKVSVLFDRVVFRQTNARFFRKPTSTIVPTKKAAIKTLRIRKVSAFGTLGRHVPHLCPLVRTYLIEQGVLPKW